MIFLAKLANVRDNILTESTKVSHAQRLPTNGFALLIQLPFSQMRYNGAEWMINASVMI
jgi:hypothetical protein